ncbi:MAG: hypothetical protein EBS76_10105, partial [Actinobacteria bacterium]|nr:hypothetical protein [Actinomycetota bacterium]
RQLLHRRRIDSIPGHIVAKCLPPARQPRHDSADRAIGDLRGLMQGLQQHRDAQAGLREFENFS